ncbi:MAG: NAD(P)H-dependent oxidoreductase [Cytophagia bacterium]|nr:NAD(P)H-dependent oxidoreductase [Cytophagia bacterium]
MANPSARNILVILGSARGDGNTFRLQSQLMQTIPHEFINLLDWKIEEYNYQDEYSQEDQFPELAAKMKDADIIVFATPVYWYSMSTQLKLFFDRMTNLTDILKSVGKALKGKEMALIAVGSSEEIPEGFTVPFSETADYFDMTFKGYIYQNSSESNFPKKDASIFGILEPFKK